MTLNRREMLRLGTLGAAGAILSTSASSQILPSIIYPPRATRDPLAPVVPGRVAAQPVAPTAPAGIDPQLFARAKAALDQHQIYPRDTIGIVDFSQPSSEERFHVVDLASGQRREPPGLPRPRLRSRALGLPRALFQRLRLLRDVGRDLRHRRLLPGQVRPVAAGPRPRLFEQQCRAARHRHPQRLVCRGRHDPASRPARPLGRLLRNVAQEPVRSHAPPRRWPHDLRRQARLSGGARGSRRTRTLSYS